jgi:hypothetical protein
MSAKYPADITDKRTQQTVHIDTSSCEKFIIILSKSWEHEMAAASRDIITSLFPVFI